MPERIQTKMKKSKIHFVEMTKQEAADLITAMENAQILINYLRDDQPSDTVKELEKHILLIKNAAKPL